MERQRINGGGGTRRRDDEEDDVGTARHPTRDELDEIADRADPDPSPEPSPDADPDPSPQHPSPDELDRIADRHEPAPDPSPRHPTPEQLDRMAAERVAQFDPTTDGVERADVGETQRQQILDEVAPQFEGVSRDDIQLGRDGDEIVAWVDPAVAHQQFVDEERERQEELRAIEQQQIEQQRQEFKAELEEEYPGADIEVEYDPVEEEFVATIDGQRGPVRRAIDAARDDPRGAAVAVGTAPFRAHTRAWEGVATVADDPIGTLQESRVGAALDPVVVWPGEETDEPTLGEQILDPDDQVAREDAWRITPVGAFGAARGAPAAARRAPELPALTRDVAAATGVGGAIAIDQFGQPEIATPDERTRPAEVEVPEEPAMPAEVAVPTATITTAEVDAPEEPVRPTAEVPAPERPVDPSPEIGAPVETAPAFGQPTAIEREAERLRHEQETPVITPEQLVDPDELRRQEQEELRRQVEEHAIWTEEHPDEFVEPVEPVWTVDRREAVEREVEPFEEPADVVDHPTETVRITDRPLDRVAPVEDTRLRADPLTEAEPLVTTTPALQMATATAPVSAAHPVMHETTFEHVTHAPTQPGVRDRRRARPRFDRRRHDALFDPSPVEDGPWDREWERPVADPGEIFGDGPFGGDPFG